MKRRAIIYPFLFSANFVLVSLASNISEVPLSQAIRPLTIVLIGTGVLLSALQWAVRDWDRAAFMSLLCLLALLYFGHLYSLAAGLTIGGYALKQRVVFFLLLALLLVGLCSGRVWRFLSDKKEGITNFLNLLSLVIILLPVLVVAEFWIQTSRANQAFRARQAEIEELTVSLPGSDRPDIYYVILDGYGRADVLREIYQYDNSDLIGSLTERGFVVAGQSRSNYDHTFLSLASSLNLDYVNQAVEPLESSPDRTPLTDWIEHSRVRTVLEKAGYQTVSISSGVLLSEISDADVTLSRYPKTVSDFERLLLSISALQVPVELLNADTPINGYHAYRERMLYAFDRLQQLPATVGSPKFVFVHILAPHPPFVFDRDGEQIQPDRPFFLGDASGYPGSRQEYLTGYADQLRFINQLLRETVDGILTRSKEPPIIILQGDHGPGAFFSWHSADEACLWERFSIFNAYYLPNKGARGLYESITPVNTFRIIFDTYFGAQLAALEDRSYFSTWDRPYEFSDVSERSQQRCDLP